MVRNKAVTDTICTYGSDDQLPDRRTFPWKQRAEMRQELFWSEMEVKKKKKEIEALEGGSAWLWPSSCWGDCAGWRCCWCWGGRRLNKHNTSVVGWTGWPDVHFSLGSAQFVNMYWHKVRLAGGPTGFYLCSAANVNGPRIFTLNLFLYSSSF